MKTKAGDWLLCIKTSPDRSAQKGRFYQVAYYIDANNLVMGPPLRGAWTPPEKSRSLFIVIDKKSMSPLERIIYGIGE